METKAEGSAQAEKPEDAEAIKKALEQEEQDEKNIVVEDLNVFDVKDVCDCGNGEPLFANFAWEDWMAVALRYELHLLAHSFKEDIDDEQRPSFHETHLIFYYNKYFK